MKIKHKHDSPEDREGANYSHYFTQLETQANTQPKILSTNNLYMSFAKKFDPILDEYAALRKKQNPRAEKLYSIHKPHLDKLIAELSNEITTLESSSPKKAKFFYKKYGHLLYNRRA